MLADLIFSEEIIVVNMESEPNYKKMDTVVKLDSVSFSFPNLLDIKVETIQ